MRERKISQAFNGADSDVESERNIAPQLPTRMVQNNRTSESSSDSDSDSSKSSEAEQPEIVSKSPRLSDVRQQIRPPTSSSKDVVDPLDEFIKQNPDLQKVEVDDDYSDEEVVCMVQIPKSVDPAVLLNKNINFDGKTKLEINKTKFVLKESPLVQDPSLLIGKDVKVLPSIPIFYLVQKTHKGKSNNSVGETEEPKVFLQDEINVRHPFFGSDYETKVVLDENTEKKLMHLISSSRREAKPKKKQRQKEKSRVVQEPEKEEVIFDMLRNIDDRGRMEETEETPIVYHKNKKRKEAVIDEVLDSVSESMAPVDSGYSGTSSELTVKRKSKVKDMSSRYSGFSLSGLKEGGDREVTQNQKRKSPPQKSYAPYDDEASEALPKNRISSSLEYDITRGGDDTSIDTSDSSPKKKRKKKSGQGLSDLSVDGEKQKRKQKVDSEEAPKQNADLMQRMLNSFDNSVVEENHEAAINTSELGPKKKRKKKSGQGLSELSSDGEKQKQKENVSARKEFVDALDEDEDSQVLKQNADLMQRMVNSFENSVVEEDCEAAIDTSKLSSKKKRKKKNSQGLSDLSSDGEKQKQNVSTRKEFVDALDGDENSEVPKQNADLMQRMLNSLENSMMKEEIEMASDTSVSHKRKKKRKESGQDLSDLSFEEEKPHVVDTSVGHNKNCLSLSDLSFEEEKPRLNLPDGWNDFEFVSLKREYASSVENDDYGSSGYKGDDKYVVSFDTKTEETSSVKSKKRKRTSNGSQLEETSVTEEETSPLVKKRKKGTFERDLGGESSSTPTPRKRPKKEPVAEEESPQDNKLMLELLNSVKNEINNSSSARKKKKLH